MKKSNYLSHIKYQNEKSLRTRKLSFEFVEAALNRPKVEYFIQSQIRRKYLSEEYRTEEKSIQ